MSTPRDTPPRHNIVSGTQVASLWLDESGSRTTARDCFVVAGIKVRNADKLLREIQGIRDDHQEHKHELKFGRITERTYKIYLDVIEALADHNVRLIASVVDGSVFNPFKDTSDPWRAHAHVIGRLVQGNVNKNEVVTVMVDGISTPRDVAMGQVIKRGVNGRVGATVVVDAVSLNSKSNDLLQVADMVAGSIFHQRLKAGRAEDPLKGKVAQRLAWAFEQTDLSDVRGGKISIATLQEWRDARWASENATSAPARSRGARR